MGRHPCLPVPLPIDRAGSTRKIGPRRRRRRNGRRQHDARLPFPVPVRVAVRDPSDYLRQQCWYLRAAAAWEGALRATFGCSRRCGAGRDPAAAERCSVRIRPCCGWVRSSTARFHIA